MLLSVFYGIVFIGVAVLSAKARISLWSMILIFILGLTVGISRDALNTGDLPTYVEGFVTNDWSIYFLKEAPFWYVGRVITNVTSNVNAAFFVIDNLILWLIIQAFSGRLKAPFFLILWSFPTILGYTNIYRQLVASALMMVSFKYIQRTPYKGVALALLACFVHTAMIGLCVILTVTYLVFLRRYFWLSVLLLASVASVVLFMPPDLTLFDITGGSPTRDDTRFLYMGAASIVHVIGYRFLRISGDDRTQHIALILYFIAGAVSLAFVPESTGTRIMMISMYLTTYLTCVKISQIGVGHVDAIISLLILYVLLVIPLAISTSAWHLIFGYELK